MENGNIKRILTSYVQENSCKELSAENWIFFNWLSSSNSVGQKGVAWCISSDKREKPTTRIHSKAFIQIWWKDQKFYRKAKAKGVQQHHSNFTRNIKRTPYKKEKAKTRYTKGKISLVKANIE